MTAPLQAQATIAAAIQRTRGSGGRAAASYGVERRRS